MEKDRWEVLAVSRGKGGQFYMELCDGSAVRREPVEPTEASILLASLARGNPLYATQLDRPPVEAFKDEEEE